MPPDTPLGLLRRALPELPPRLRETEARLAALSEYVPGRESPP